MKANKIICGDCLEVMQGFPDNCIDSIVTDPPYGWSFMGKQWDYDIPKVEVWQEALRVLKPGGHALIACGTRTQHRMAVNIEDAGFGIRDLIFWHHSMGFPKSHNIGVATDKLLGREREVIPNPKAKQQTEAKSGVYGDYEATTHISKGTSRYEGWGTALKPATEIFTLARKPLSEKTIAENVLKWGTGGLNIDGCRIYRDKNDKSGWSVTGSKESENRAMSGKNYERDAKNDNPQGRFPSNVILDGSEEVLQGFPKTKSTAGLRKNKYNAVNAYSGDKAKNIMVNHNDSGSAARFFYTAKASRRERSKANNHPTVKPIKLMKYLCKLITPPKGICLDLYAGSGSTVFACIEEGFNFVAIEIDPEYCKIANQRINNAQLSLF